MDQRNLYTKDSRFVLYKLPCSESSELFVEELFVVDPDISELHVVEVVADVPVVVEPPVVEPPVEHPSVDSSNRAGTFENGPSINVSVAPIKFGLVFRQEDRCRTDFEA